ncbi:GGDEF domain-containing protein [Catellatospora citrea]|uniref:GGDEF domain-containing protein n=1 Tax=Catellatospora citrea TaxID=53366 RepID=A0A8J3KRY9_9ACTN|nr:GGDEF domain-containing protein [Catellatospora citrea]RKE07913.1 diguanylate cyclase (GGDEF)-like protein [Catellatospora citrea]GIG02076.1 hypothetical protein Cci01nite_71690 [Catellatospora citrea]
MFTTILVIATICAALTFAAGACVGFGLGCLAAWSTVAQLRAELVDAVWQLAHDPLTGLLNRTGLHSVHAAATGQPQPIIVMLLDLDGFKEVNDAYGHGTGDDLLIETADRLARLADANGGSAARLSGDEYAAILPVRDQAITDLADRFTNALAEPVKVDTDTGPVMVAVTASIGIAIVGNTEPLEDTALHQADTAMYHAKNQGGNRHILYTPGMTMPDRQHRRGSRLRDLRHSRRAVGAA